MRSYTITLRLPGGDERPLAVSPHEFILDAALRAGLDLPHRCLQGWCLSCAARLVTGQVDQEAARRYFPEDAQAGFVLICTARPISDAVVETHAREAMRGHRRARGLPFPLGDWGVLNARPSPRTPAGSRTTQDTESGPLPRARAENAGGTRERVQVPVSSGRGRRPG